MSSSRREEPLLLPLRCPACGGALDPMPDDVLFLCAGCGGASELAGTSTVRRELRHRSPSTREKVLHLPFWRLSRSEMTPAFNGSRLLTVTRWYSERLARVDGYPEGPAPRGLWGGRIGAADAPRLAALAWEDGDRSGATRASAEPNRPGSHVTVSAQGASVTVTAVHRWTAGDPDPARLGRPEAAAAPAPETVRTARPASPPVLFAVPFHPEPSRLVCAVTGLHLYLETLEGSAALLERWRERTGA